MQRALSSDQVAHLRRLDADGSADASVTKTSPDVRVHHRTEKGEAAARDVDL